VLQATHNGGAALAAGGITLQGTGATFPAPLYQRWFAEYNKLHSDVQINYQALGSGAGIKQFQQGWSISVPVTRQ
jgi:phosphate transport system substrate-binding protein